MDNVLGFEARDIELQSRCENRQRYSGIFKWRVSNRMKLAFKILTLTTIRLSYKTDDCAWIFLIPTMKAYINISSIHNLIYGIFSRNFNVRLQDDQNDLLIFWNDCILNGSFWISPLLSYYATERSSCDNVLLCKGNFHRKLMSNRKRNLGDTEGHYAVIWD